MDNIFLQTAPLYWANGLPAMPVLPKSKSAFIKNWQSLSERMVTPEEQTAWLKNYPNYNIGLPLGQQSGIVVLDIDTEDDILINLIKSLVPQSPWCRIGKKGAVMAYRYNGESSFQIKSSDKGVICEVLSSHKQVILPPSIHPDTLQPYTANCELCSVLKNLPVLPKDLKEILTEQLRGHVKTLVTSGERTRTIDYVPAGCRDVKMTSMAGIYAQSVLRGEITLKDAIEALITWSEEFTQKVAGDPINIKAGIANLIKFMMNDVNGPKKKSLPNGWDLGLTPEDKKNYGLDINEEESVQWSATQLREHLKSVFQKYDSEENPKRQEEIAKTINRLAKAKLTTLEEDAIIRYIALMNRSIAVPAIRKTLNELRQEGIEGLNHSEIARAALADLNERFKTNEYNYKELYEYDNIRFVESVFWKWNGAFWEKLEESEILKHLSIEYGYLPAATKANDHRGILAVMKNLVGHVLQQDDTKGVNMANGFVTFDGVVHPHSKKYGCRYCMTYCYDPSKGKSLDDAPLFKDFLFKTWGHEPDYEDRIKCLRDVMTATVFGLGPSFERAVLLHGLAGSGKSQLMNIVEALMPPEAVSYTSPYMFSDKFSVTRINGTLLNVCGELSENKSIPGDRFKQIVDGQTIEGQYKGCQNFWFEPKCMHWFASNHLPKTKDNTEGFYRRWVILDFKRIVPKEEKIRDYGVIIASQEKDVIMAWVINNAQNLMQRGDYILPNSHYVKVNEICSENDTLFFYLTSEEGPRLKETSSLTLVKLYDTYRSFCYEKAGASPVGSRKFYARLKELGALMRFSVTNTEAVGLTLEKEQGFPLTKIA